MRKFLTILNITLLGTLIVLTLFVFGIIDIPFFNSEPQTNPIQIEAPDKIERSKSYDELMQKGDTYYQGGMYTLAIDSYTKASEKEPDAITPLIKIGNLNILLGNHEQAKNLALKILKKKETNVSAKVILGRANLGLEKYTEAKQIFDSLNSDDPEVKYFQAVVALFFGEYERARGLLNGLEGGNADKLTDAMNEFDLYQAGLHEHLKVLVARAFIQIEEPHLAKDLLWQVLKENRNYRDAWIVLGYSYLKLNKFPEAIDALEEAKRQDSDKPETLFFLGLAYAGNNELERAVGELNKALKFGYEPKIHIEQKLAELYFQLENFEKASELYEDVISLNAGDINYFIRPVWVYIDKLSQPARAVALAEKAVINHPENPMSYNLLGWAQIANNDYINATKNLQRALTYDPGFDAPYLNLGWMYEKKGDIGRAKELYRKAFELGGGSPVGSLAAERYNELLVNVLN